MSQKFQASVQHRGDVSYVKLGGVIDEDNELGDLVDKIPTGTAVIDLGEIERINSCGVRDWVNWLSQAREQRHPLGARRVLAGDRRADQPRQQLHRQRRRQELLRPVLLPRVRRGEGAARRGRPTWVRRRTSRRPVAVTSAISSWTSTTCRTRTSRSCRTSEARRARQDQRRDARPRPRLRCRRRQGQGPVAREPAEPRLERLGSKPSVPSLPSIQRTSTQPAAAQYQPGPQGGGRKPTPSRPPLGPGSLPASGGRTAPARAPARRHAPQRRPLLAAGRRLRLRAARLDEPGLGALALERAGVRADRDPARGDRRARVPRPHEVARRAGDPACYGRPRCAGIAAMISRAGGCSPASAPARRPA